MPARDGPWSEWLVVSPPEVTPDAVTMEMSLTVTDFVTGTKTFSVASVYSGIDSVPAGRIQLANNADFTGTLQFSSPTFALGASGTIATVDRAVGAGKYARCRVKIGTDYFFSNVIGPFEAAGTSGAPVQTPTFEWPDMESGSRFVKWTKVDRITNYEIEVNQNDVIGWFRIITLDPTFLGAFIPIQYLQQFFRFRMRGYNSDGAGPYSNVIEYVTGEGLEPFYTGDFSVACFIGERDFA